MPSDAQETIGSLVKSERVVLFMKGDRQRPQCGFSATVVQLLDGLLDDYRTVDVLEAPAIRDGIKQFSNWPTIPQLYIDGEFIGGCDIVRDLHASGELQKKLGVKEAELVIPTLTITPTAARELEAALADADPGEQIALSISARFEHALNLGPPGPTDVSVSAGGVTLFLDRASARRADQVRIDFIEDGAQAGFKIDNPNAPPAVEQISASELKQMLETGKIAELIDVRPDEERAIAKIDRATPLNEQTLARLEKLPKETPIAFHCKKGGRSQKVAEQMLARGFTKVYNLAGGINAWSQEIDPKVPTY